VHLQQIGPPVEHRGLRYPSMMSVHEIIDGLNFFLRPMFAVIASEIDASYRNVETTRG